MISRSDLSHSSSGVKLPKLELPTFSGDVLSWTSFWDMFNCHIHSSEQISDVAKFGYLKSCLQGRALKVVEALTLTHDNYKVAVDTLKNRFGRDEQIIFSHVLELLNLKTTVTASHDDSKYVAQLWTLRDKIELHVQNLSSLGVPGTEYAVFLVPIILSALPADIRAEWSREGEGHERDLDHCLKFLQREIQRIERSNVFTGLASSQPTADDKRTPKPRPKPADVTTVTALHTQSSSAAAGYKGPTCVFCKKRHLSEKCFEVLKLSGQKRYDRILEADVCARCLNPGHRAKICDKKCSRCYGNHNALMCGIILDFKSRSEAKTDSKSETKSAGIIVEDSSETSLVSNVSTDDSDSDMRTVLQTAKVPFVCPNGEKVNVKVMCDSGADIVYISSKCAQKYNPKYLGRKFNNYCSFGGHKGSKAVERNVFEIQLQCLNNSIMKFKAVEIPVICQPLIRPQIPTEILDQFRHVKLADEYPQNEPLEIDVLLGLTAYWKVISPRDPIIVDDIVALKSVFGYVLSGVFDSENIENEVSMMNVQFMCISNVSDQECSRFWDLESVGIDGSTAKKPTDDSVLTEFNKTIKYVDNKYEVSLPWKDDNCKHDLINNESQAMKSLVRLNCRLNKNVQLKENYAKVFDEYESLGIIEEVAADSVGLEKAVNYLPHFPVVQEGNVTTPVRPVFNCSATQITGKSLNDCLDKGPSLNPSLVDTS